ncbi:MAG TPA: hypothetical protein VGK35_02765 [Actinotalea sp.]
MPPPTGFTYTSSADGSVTIRHHDRVATTLRGARAATFLAEVEANDDQLTMARWTGNYRRGNERTAKLHPRNAHRRSGRSDKGVMG